jgi:hypothetical protein
MSDVTSLQAHDTRVYGGAHPTPTASVATAPTDIYLMCYGHDFLASTQQLTSITGKAPLMPAASSTIPPAKLQTFWACGAYYYNRPGHHWPRTAKGALFLKQTMA